MRVLVVFLVLGLNLQGHFGILRIVARFLKGGQVSEGWHATLYGLEATESVSAGPGAERHVRVRDSACDLGRVTVTAADGLEE